MRIPSGDLAPARRRRRHAFGRRRSRTLPVLLVLLLLGAVAGGVLLVRRDDGPGQLAAGRCPTPAALQPVAQQPVALGQVALPASASVRFRILNGTGRDGLGRTVGDALAARGFAVLSTGNASGPLAGRSQVRFGPGGRLAATLLAAHVSGGVLRPVPSAPHGAVDLVLGSAFVRLRTPAEVATALRQAAPGQPSSPAPGAAAPAPSRAAVPC